MYKDLGTSQRTIMTPGPVEVDPRVLRAMCAPMLGQFDPENEVPFSKIPLKVVDNEEYRHLALEAARKSIVLLENPKDMLPFTKKVKRVAVIGPNADNIFNRADKDFAITDLAC